MAVEKVSKERLEEILKTSQGTVVVDFFADWCGPCKMFAPVLDKVAEKNPHITVVKMNIDEETDYAISQKVSAVPTMVVYKAGQETARTQGFIPEQQVMEAIG